MTISAEELHARIMRRVADNEIRRAAPGTTYPDAPLLPPGIPEDVGLYPYVEEERKVKSYTPPFTKDKDLHRPASPRDAEGESGFASGVEEVLSLPPGDHAEDKDRHEETSRANRKPKPRTKTPDEIAKLERAKEGLPPASKINWMRVQMWDNGERRGRTRFRLKLTATARPPHFIDRTKGNIERYSDLSKAKQFRTNAVRKRGEISADEWETVQQCIDLVQAAHKNRAPDQPEALAGFVSLKFQGLGTQRYPGQFVVLLWEQIDDDWQPVAHVISGDGLIPVPLISRRDDPDRHEKASDWVGSYFSNSYKALLEQRAAKNKGAA